VPQLRKKKSKHARAGRAKGQTEVIDVRDEDELDLVPQLPAKECSLVTAEKTTCQAGGTHADLATLRRHANQGNPKAQAQLKSWLDKNPDVCRTIGDLAHHAQMEFIRLVTKGDFLFTEAIRRRADEMRRELLGTFPTPLELLATERVVAAWLQTQHVEGQIALSDEEIPKAKFWLQRQLQANRLLHAATKSLLLIRELLPPAAAPAALAANGTATTKINGKSRLAVGANGHKPSRQRESTAAPVNRINGAAKNGKHPALATV
jgi:hypothetical protein